MREIEYPQIDFSQIVTTHTVPNQFPVFQAEMTKRDIEILRKALDQDMPWSIQPYRQPMIESCYQSSFTKAKNIKNNKLKFIMSQNNES